MSSDITIYPFNLLSESGSTVTVTGTADTGYPETRLYDRSIGLHWKDTVTEAKNFQVDAGAAVSIDFLAIVGHNFDGEDLEWQYSDTGAWAGEESDFVTDWTQSGNAQIIKTATAASHRYWQVTLSSMANPQCAEIYMSKGYTFDVMINPSGPRLDRVQWNITEGGLERSTKRGDVRRVRNYQWFLSAADLATFNDTVLPYLDELSLPFFLRDHNDDYFLARFGEAPGHVWDNPNYTHVPVSFIEVLG